MLKVSSTAADVKVKIFSGEPAKVEKELADFLGQKKLKIHGFAQSQSSVGHEVIITATVLYTEFEGMQEEKIGFNR